jgi:hypothetical protein
MLVEVLTSHGNSQTQHGWVGAGATCSIGRALTNDIVLDDQYAAAAHTRLTLLEDGRVAVADLGSRNGTRVDGELIGPEFAIANEGVLIVGRTRVRVRTLLAPMPPERLFRRDVLQRHRTVLAIAGLALMLGYLAFNQWVAAPEKFARDAFVIQLTALGVIGVWVALWALLTRISHGIWNIRSHVAIVAGTVGLALWMVSFSEAAQFAFQWRGFAVLAGFVTTAAALGALFLHLRKATHLSLRMAAAIAVAVPLTLGGVATWISTQDGNRDVNRLERGAPVMPPNLRIAGSIELDDFLANANALRREAARNRQTSLAEMPLAGPDE